MLRIPLVLVFVSTLTFIAIAAPLESQPLLNGDRSLVSDTNSRKSVVGRFQITTCGQMAILIDTASGFTWLLGKESSEKKSAPIWVPIERHYPKDNADFNPFQGESGQPKTPGEEAQRDKPR